MSLWATKSITVLRAEADAVNERSLKRHLGALNLITLGIGAIIGAGIFVLTGQAAALHAGPAVALSFIFAGITCAFAGLCYSEFASIIPIAGSAYTYGYATLGELVAFFAILVVTTVLVIGIKESANLNSAIVIVKLTIVGVFLVLGGAYLFHHPELARVNWHPFIPPSEGAGRFGFGGITAGAASV